jgi:hypothetical protein
MHCEGCDRPGRLEWVCCRFFDDLTCMPGAQSLLVVFSRSVRKTAPPPQADAHVSPSPAPAAAPLLHSIAQLHSRTPTPLTHAQLNCNIYSTPIRTCRSSVTRRREQRRRAARSGVLYSHGSHCEAADASMESRRRPEYNLDIFADLACVKDVVKGASAGPVCFARFSQQNWAATPPPCPLPPSGVPRGAVADPTDSNPAHNLLPPLLHLDIAPHPRPARPDPPRH